ncbi:glucose sorbosone dehydrogenase [Sulfurifustis variabilis]|uniref:Glucose sorbosone dehydrogenase n=1 Tax=Sulfurifustis variabilis TaxID=1675686 RepID=A0A1B4VFI7_9GAMM|nr:PQQ-dependent sugar dehydrogenase [Sulfurifustis variabilis]BAU49507.1 glucose sorbosone dehydrogenase [Sulfurifustis variabilis]
MALWRDSAFACLLLAAACGSSDDARRIEIPVIALEEVGTGFVDPVHLAASGDGSGRLFVVEQRGTVRAIENGRPAAQRFLDIGARVESGGEKGLLSIAFHPRYADNRTFFVDYTTRIEGRLTSIVSRWREAGGRADPASEEVLLAIDQPFDNHNGGQLAFGPDGFLYIGKGDGGSGNDPHGHGQNAGTLLGALLRIDVDAVDPPLAYRIPPDNPFVGQAGARGEIYAYGLRNPWRFSFDPETGLLYLGDVGQGAREEIDVVTRGGNYGWRIMEGDICTPGVNPRCDPTGLIPPIHVYPTGDLGRSVTGGFVYRGTRVPALTGLYVYADYLSGRIWALRYDGTRVTEQRELLHTPYRISTFGRDDEGELYVADHAGGRIFRIVPAGN